MCVQVIDDSTGHTLVAASTVTKDMKANEEIDGSTVVSLRTLPQPLLFRCVGSAYCLCIEW